MYLVSKFLYFFQTKMESGESEEDDFKLVKRKIVATDKLLKHIVSLLGSCALHDKMFLVTII